MSLPRRPKEWRPGSLPLTITELFGQIRLKAWTTTGTPVKLLAETDGTLRVAQVVVHSTVVGKLLGAVIPVAGAATIVYTVPALTTGEIATLSACNQSETKTTIRLALLAAGGSTPSTHEYVYFDLPLDPGATLLLDAAQGVWLEAAATVVGQSLNGKVSFVATGKEHT